jgi:hypothetical protein
MPSNRLNKGGSPDELARELTSPERLNTPEAPAGLPAERLNIREYLEPMFEGLLYLSEPEFDAAIVGVADRIGMPTVVVYDSSKVIDILCERDGMDREQATEFYEFNILGAYVGERTPMHMTLLDDLML